MCIKLIHSKVTRRDFLLYASMSSALYMLGTATNSKPAWSSTSNGYYQAHSERYMESFEKTITSATSYLRALYDNKIAQEICQSARKEFKLLLPGVPYIGGDKNLGTKYLLQAAYWISFLHPMKRRGYSIETTAFMMYNLFVQYLNTIPKELMTKRGEYFFSQRYITLLKRWSNASKTQQIDWVIDFIPGDGKHFDYGIDYLYCPCLELFKSQDAEDIAPYFCIIDFPESEKMNTGLERKMTLAQGHKFCDFRYKKGRAVTQNWSTEVSKFR